MRAQARVVQDWLYYFGGLADKVEGSVIPLDRTSVLNYTLNEPLGVIAVIVPWNSPTLLSIMSVAPALAAGNTVVVKPSEVTSASAIELAGSPNRRAFPRASSTSSPAAGRPARRWSTTPGRQDLVHRQRHRRARDRRTRRTRLVSCTLELGGKSANIVFDDADLDQAEAGVLAGIFAAAGQTCVAGSRAFFHAASTTPSSARLVERARQIRLATR